jgi:hypothetical protein
LVQSNVDQTRCSSVDKDSALFVVGELQKLLAEVITEGIYGR